jgi:hypothetical protein
LLHFLHKLIEPFLIFVFCYDVRVSSRYSESKLVLCGFGYYYSCVEKFQLLRATQNIFRQSFGGDLAKVCSGSQNFHERTTDNSYSADLNQRCRFPDHQICRQKC